MFTDFRERGREEVRERERETETETERDRERRPSVASQMCPSWGSILQPLVYRMMLQPTEPPGQGRHSWDSASSWPLPSSQPHLSPCPPCCWLLTHALISLYSCSFQVQNTCVALSVTWVLSCFIPMLPLELWALHITVPISPVPQGWAHGKCLLNMKKVNELVSLLTGKNYL